jgi:hypothetical protein
MRRNRYRPDANGNWRMVVEPAILKMKKIGWGKWAPKQIHGSTKAIFLPTAVRID